MLLMQFDPNPELDPCPLPPLPLPELDPCPLPPLPFPELDPWPPLPPPLELDAVEPPPPPELLPWPPLLLPELLSVGVLEALLSLQDHPAATAVAPIEAKRMSFSIFIEGNLHPQKARILHNVSIAPPFRDATDQLLPGVRFYGGATTGAFELEPTGATRAA